MPKICSHRSVKKTERRGGYEGKNESRNFELIEIADIGSDVRFGSKADLTARIDLVGFAATSGHCLRVSASRIVRRIESLWA